MQIKQIATWSHTRALYWQGQDLYVAKGYKIFKILCNENLRWNYVAKFNPSWWRQVTSRHRLTYRLLREGFHSLVILSSDSMIATIPGAIVNLTPCSDKFLISHRIMRGTRPLNLSVTADERIYWGEYFNNPSREEVHIYGSFDHGRTWQVVYTFPEKSIRHIHGIVYDKWFDCLWILTGDYGDECKIIRASCDLKKVDILLSGNQQARAVTLIPTEKAIYFASDTPLEQNYIYRLHRDGTVNRISDISSSSFYGCEVSTKLFFSTVAEPSEVNTCRDIKLYGSSEGSTWKILLERHKDIWPMTFFQYGNIFLPSGENQTNYLATSFVAVKKSDLKTSLFQIL